MLAAQALYETLRDDSEATVGIRALLGNTTATPYNVHHAFLPEAIDFSAAGGTKAFIVYQFISGTPDNTSHNRAALLSQEVYSVTVYARSLAKIIAVHKRVKLLLHDKRSVTDPSSGVVIFRMALDAQNPPRFDDAFETWFQSAFYRAWVRDDNLS